MSNHSIKFNAFTIKFDKIVDVLECPVKISLKTYKQKLPKKHLTINAMWDCGSNCSIVTEKAAKRLKMMPIDVIKVVSLKVSAFEKVYVIDIYLPNDIKMPQIKVSECIELPGNYDLLIGMDIISKGDFAVSNFDGKTVFTFRVPSKETIDFVE